MTKKMLAALTLVLLLAALSASAQTPPDWVKFNSPGPPFSVLMPAEPKETKHTGRSPNGPYTIHLFNSFGAESEVYIAGWVDYDSKADFDVQAELEINRDNFVKSLKAKLLSTTPIKLGAHPGIEFKAEVTGKGDVVARFYIVGRRPHVLVVLTPTGHDSSAKRERFFASFQLGAPK